MKLLAPLFAILFSMVHTAAASAAEAIDIEAFYGRQPGQVFQAQDRQAFQLGYSESRPDEPILTWEGLVGLRSLYVEVQGDRLKLIHDQGSRILRFADARILRRELRRGLDVNNAGLYVTPGHADRPGLLCIEAFGAGMHRSTPDREVYVVLDPLGNPTLFKLPRHQARAAGITRTGSRSYAVPVVQEPSGGTGEVILQYHRLTRAGYRPQGRPIVAHRAPGDAFRLELTP